MTLPIAGRTSLALLVLSFATTSAGAQTGPAGDPAAGRKLARMCAACHGFDGIARNPEAANLAGQDSQYIMRQLRAFRGGERKNDTMSLVASSLSDQQIADAAAYYGGIEIRVLKLPGGNPGTAANPP